MSTTESEAGLALPEADTEPSTAASLDEPNAQKRRCVATLMDRHPETFARPEAAATWIDFAEQRCVPQGRDQLTLDMAIGRLIQVMRAAQEGIPERGDLQELLRMAEEEGVSGLEPDAAVQTMASPDAPAEEVQLMARAMSLYKNCLANGVAQGDEITNAIDAGFDYVPANSPLMRSLIETAKEITLVDVRYALGIT